VIAPLRRRHRRTFAVLAVLLPTLFAAALLVREQTPRVAELPARRELGRTPLLAQPVAPDPLLYWSAGSVAAGDPLPGDARLLGALRSGDLLAGLAGTQLPAGGTRFVYSLVDQRISAVLPAASPTRGAR
jgi:hypothetical protein